MANIVNRNKALALRKKGRSIAEIAGNLDVPKSTVGVWCRNLKLGRKQINRLARRQASGSYRGRMNFLEKVRKIRLLQTEKLKIEGISEVGNIGKRDLLIAGVAMYLSEGSTSASNEEVSFTNSDFRTVLLMKKWFSEICGATNDRFIVQIRINKIYKNKVTDTENYWAKMLDIPLSQFSKTVLIKSKIKKIYPEDNIYCGTVRLKVKKGTQLRRKINGWVEGLLRI